MRPIRIRVEGFSAFRTSVELTFDAVEFFSLSGPTGSGKSSIIDALVFALYGRVPRLGGSSVAPAISAGVDRARVAFDFEVDDVEYTAVRLVERTKSGGASVKEARLQSGDSVVADGADDVTTAVEALLKLRYEDFTRTVVLPQGDFAQFLTATKSERQSLLRNLLGLDMYTVVRGLAKTRAAVVGDRAEIARVSLESLIIPDEDAIDLAKTRLADIEGLAAQVGETEQSLTVLDGQVAHSQLEMDRLTDAMGRLDAIVPPDHLETLDGLANDARDAVATAENSLKTTQTELSSLENILADLVTPPQIEAYRMSHHSLADLEARIATNNLESVEAEVGLLSKAFDETVETLQQTRRLLSQARVSHAAHALVSSLVVGEPCPVCEHEVLGLPDQDTPSELEQLEANDAAQLQRREEARLDLDEARRRLAGAQATFSEQTQQLARLRDSTVDIPNLEQLVRMEDEYQNMLITVEKGRANLAACDVQFNSAQKELDGLADAVRRVARQLTAAQLEVADLKPPVSEADDAVVRWKDLLRWRDEAKAETAVETDAAVLAVSVAVDAATQARDELTASLHKSGVPHIEPYSAQVAAELEKARRRVGDNEEILSKVKNIEMEIDKSASEAAVADVLAGHLRANGFEQWLMAGALSDLVDGANGLLGELSSGGYSLHSDDVGTFSIVDHRNADEVRSVSTLSGGETFLVSLALALSLAETLAAAGGARLDAIILDEGFGTLDTESLDTVASVLEGLAGEGLMVGVITHVKELASRAPTRFEVTREPTGSKVALVS